MSEEIVEVEDSEVETDDTSVEETDVEEVDTDEQEQSEEIDWEARAKKAEALIVKNKQKPKKVTKSVDSDLKETVERQGLRLEGYSPEVVDKIMELGGAKALENPIVKKAAQELQEQSKAEKAADVTAGSRSVGKTKYSKEDLANMSVDEMEKILPHADN